MKKLIAMMLLVVSLVAVLVSCGSFKCAVCGEEKTDLWEESYGGYKGETEEKDGVTYGICEDCGAELEALMNK